MLIYKTLDAQNIFDIALQLYGDVSKAVQIMQDNPNINSITEDFPGGTRVKYSSLRNSIRVYYQNNNITVATNDAGETAGKAFDDSFNQDFN